MLFIDLTSQARPQFLVERLDPRRLLSADAGVDESDLEPTGTDEVIDYTFDESNPDSWIWCSFEVMPLMLDETVEEPVATPEADAEGEVVIYTMTDDVLMMGSDDPSVEPDVSVQTGVIDDAPTETPPLAPPPTSGEIARVDRLDSAFTTIFASNPDDVSVI